MKTILFFVIILFLFSCNKDKWNAPFTSDNPYPETRSITSHTSYYFDWEDTNQIVIPGIEGFIKLPWYNGAATSIPDFILRDYKKTDGWEMVYNLCNDPLEIQIGRAYLMFYNIFTGIFRVFVFNPNNTTTASTTFWHISLNNSCSLLNNIANIASPMDKCANDLLETYSTNITTSPAKALSRGWNCFDFETCYNKNIPDIPVSMSIGMFDVQSEKIKLKGNITLDTEGTIISTTTSNPVSTAINNTAKVAGKDVKAYLEKELKNSPLKNIISGVVSGGVTGLIKNGVNLIFGSFIGKFSKPQITIQDVRLTTKGVFSAEGVIQNLYQSNILPVANLMVPGSNNDSGENSLLPNYNENLGTWNLETAPIVYCGRPHLELSPYLEKYLIEYHPRQYLNSRLTRLRQPYYYDPTSVKICINPAILDKIEKYTVDSKLTHYYNYSYKYYCYLRDSNPRWSGFEEGFLLYSNDSLTIFENNHFNHYSDTRYLAYPMQICKLIDQNKYDPIFPALPTGLSGVEFQVKVSVTLYPKEPYNTTPIIITRSYHPIIKSDSTL